jgi:MFS family permease
MKADYLKRFALFQRDVRLYFISLAVALFTIGMWSVLYNLLLVRLGYGPEFVGLVGAVGALAYATSCLLSGALGRWLGSRRLIVYGFCLGTLGLLMAGSGQFVSQVLRSGWMVAACIFAYAAFAMCYSSGIPFVMRATSSEHRNYAFSVRTSLRPLTGFLGGIAGGLLPGTLSAFLRLSADGPSGYSYSFLLAGVISVAAIVVMQATDKTGAWDADSTSDRTSALPAKLIIIVTLFGLLQQAGGSVVTTFVNIYLDTELGVTTAHIGLLLALAKLVAVPAALAFPILAKRIGIYRTAVVATVGAGISAFILALIPHWIAAAVGITGVIALGMVTITSVVVYSQQLVTEEWRSIAAGTLAMGLGLGGTTSSLAGGYAIAAFGYRPLFAVGAMVTAAAAALFGVYFRVPRGELGPETDGPPTVAAEAT